MARFVNNRKTKGVMGNSHFLLVVLFMADFTAPAALFSQGDYERNLQSQSERRKKKEERRKKEEGRRKQTQFQIQYKPILLLSNSNEINTHSLSQTTHFSFISTSLFLFQFHSHSLFFPSLSSEMEQIMAVYKIQACGIV